MKRYTLWKIDEKDWLLEVDDDALGEWVKKAELKVERFAVGINVPLRVFKVKEENVTEVAEQIEKHLKRKEKQIWENGKK